MLFIVGLLGFALGFLSGQMALAILLKNRSREDLLNDPGLRWKYGTLNWLFALLGMGAVMAGWQHWMGS